MPRHYEIDSAWRASIKREPNGRQRGLRANGMETYVKNIIY